MNVVNCYYYSQRCDGSPNTPDSVVHPNLELTLTQFVKQHGRGLSRMHLFSCFAIVLTSNIKFDPYTILYAYTRSPLFVKLCVRA